MTYNEDAWWEDVVTNSEPRTYRPLPSDKVTSAVIAEMERWFWMLERGETQYQMIDSTYPIPDDEEVERVIKMIDDYCKRELTIRPPYWYGIGQESRGKNIDLPPDFDRLEGAARVAFVQSLKRVKAENEQAGA